jgi:hypothetical protein
VNVVEYYPPLEEAVTYAPEGYTGNADELGLCNYCFLWRQCEIYNARMAMHHEFNIKLSILECPRFVQENNDG